MFGPGFVYNDLMGKKKTKKGTDSNTIVLNKKARHDYILEERFEAGLALEGWEVKALRAGKVQIRDSYILLKNSEIRTRQRRSHNWWSAICRSINL